MKNWIKFIIKLITFTLFLTASTYASYTLTWEYSPGPSGAVGFGIERAGADGNFSLISTVNSSTLAYQDLSANYSTQYSYRVYAYNNTARSGYSNTVEVVPSNVTSNSTSRALLDSSYSYTIFADNSPVSYSAIGLPSGLSLDSGTGIISGIPVSPGVFSVVIKVTNSSNGVSIFTLVITVGIPPSQIISESMPAPSTRSSLIPLSSQ